MFKNLVFDDTSNVLYIGKHTHTNTGNIAIYCNNSLEYKTWHTHPHHNITKKVVKVFIE